MCERRQNTAAPTVRTGKGRLPLITHALREPVIDPLVVAPPLCATPRQPPRAWYIPLRHKRCAHSPRQRPCARTRKARAWQSVCERRQIYGSAHRPGRGMTAFPRIALMPARPPVTRQSSLAASRRAQPRHPTHALAHPPAAIAGGGGGTRGKVVAARAVTRKRATF